MTKYYCESSLFKITIYKEAKLGNFQSRINSNKPVFEATDGEIEQLAKDLESQGMNVRVIEK